MIDINIVCTDSHHIFNSVVVNAREPEAVRMCVCTDESGTAPEQLRQQPTVSLSLSII